MPRNPQVLIYVGIKSSVVALDDSTGLEVWRTKLRGSDYVSVLWDGEALIAANSGEVWRLDPQTGGELWHNDLTGLGRGVVSLASQRLAASSSDADGAATKRRRDAQTAATVAAVAAAS